MIYVPIAEKHNYSIPIQLSRYDQYSAYALWLSKHAGPEDTAWRWKRGDLCGQGVYIEEDEVATLFKLTFQL